MADMLISPEGKEVTVDERLKDIKIRYGENSKQFLDVVEICKAVELIK